VSARAARPDTNVAGIILAGGRASRFGRDKLAEPVAGRPLLHHAAEALAPLVDELILVIPPGATPPAIPPVRLDGRPVRIVRDPEAFGGPLLAVAAALEATNAARCLLVGGDMPSLQAPVLRAMLAALGEGGADVVLLESPGPLQSMPAALRTAAARVAAGQARADGARALRALYGRLRTRALPLATWTALDPGRWTLRDVDTPGDLPREMGDLPREPGASPDGRRPIRRRASP
jgi:molybdopterin-guanine dinucleotide biosynthesis protein A